MKNSTSLKKSEYLNKPHETIQIEGKLNLLQHKCWNILALHSIKSGLREGKIRYEIPLTLLYKYLGYKTENDTYLERVLIDIMHVVVQGNIVNKDGEEDWHAFVLLSYVSISKGILYYEYPSFVAELLASPKKYVKMLIKLQNRFNSSYGLKLYEYLKTKYIEKQKWGTTGEIEIQTFRHLMGLSDGAWLEFKVLKRDLVLPAIKEINDKTDLFVELELIKNRQKVTALKFQITENPDKKKNLQDLELDLEALANVNLEHEEDQELKIKLESLGFGDAQINKFVSESDREKVLDCVDYVLMRLEKGANIKDLTAYLNTILEMHREEGLDISAVEDWRNQQRQKQEQLNQQLQDQTQQETEEAQEKVKQERDKKLIEEFKESNSEIFEKICVDYLEELEKKNKIIFNRVLKKSTELNQTLVETVKDYSMTSSEIDLRILEKIETVSS